MLKKIAIFSAIISASSASFAAGFPVSHGTSDSIIMLIADSCADNKIAHSVPYIWKCDKPFEIIFNEKTGIISLRKPDIDNDLPIVMRNISMACYSCTLSTRKFGDGEVQIRITEDGRK